MNERYRNIFKTAFDEVGGEWIWYANAWSRGVVVSSTERELFLQFRPVAFREAIHGRPALHPRRPYWPTLGRILMAMISGRDPKD
ncbi:MAG: hypothetical protein AB1942_21335 [Pseudomonadota bacterium]